MPLEVLDLIFGKDFQSEQGSSPEFKLSGPSSVGLTPPIDAMANERVLAPPRLQTDMVVNRAKSTGCHYEPKQDHTSIYNKQREGNSTPDYGDDFEDESSEEDASGEDPNLKAMMDDFAAEQEIRGKIDRRAAVQMGMVQEAVPEEIRNEYVGIDTSLTAIHSFLLNFFKYYICKSPFIQTITKTSSCASSTCPSATTSSSASAPSRATPTPSVPRRTKRGSFTASKISSATTSLKSSTRDSLKAPTKMPRQPGGPTLTSKKSTTAPCLTASTRQSTGSDPTTPSVALF